MQRIFFNHQFLGTYPIVNQEGDKGFDSLHSYIIHTDGLSSQNNMARKWKHMQVENEEVKLSLFAMIWSYT
jgi:hypothetical protein